MNSWLRLRSAWLRCLVLPACCLLFVLPSGCEQREPLSRSLVIAQADLFLEDRGWQWGPVRAVWAPPEAYDDQAHASDEAVRRWWQVDFHGPHPEGLLPLVLVDADSGWVRLPPADYRPQQVAGRSRVGSYLLVLAGDVADNAAEVERLNQRAVSDGLPPLFTIRHSRRGDQVVYGWRGDRGTDLDPGLLAWVEAQAVWAEVYWISLILD